MPRTHLLNNAQNAERFGAALIQPLVQITHREVTIVRVSTGPVTTLGFASLIRGASELLSLAGLDLANSELADELRFPYLTKALKDGGLAHLNILRLSHMELGDKHIKELSRALWGHQGLEILGVAGNKFGAESGITLFEQFTSLRRATVLDLSLNYNLGDAMIDEMCQFVGGGFPWKLKVLWIAYCNVTSEGVRKLRGLVRSGDGQLQQLVVSGITKDEPAARMLEWKRLEGECNVCHTLLLTLPHLTYYTELVSHIMADATRVAVRGTLLELLPVDLQPAPGGQGTQERRRKNKEFVGAFLASFQQYMAEKESGNLSTAQDPANSMPQALLDAGLP